MSVEKTSYTVSTETSLSFEEAVEETRGLLQEAGYGVLSEIDVASKLEEKLGIEREPYRILGTCNPALARQGLDAEPELGALLPCNVIVYELDGRVHVAAVEPRTMLSVVDNENLDNIAVQVREDLSRVVERVGNK